VRGYFGIGIDRCKTPVNIGSLLRSAHAFGADFCFTVGIRGCGKYRRTATDTTDATAHLPFTQYEDLSAFLAARPRGCQIVAVEVDGERTLGEFNHPERAMYVLGPEDGDVRKEIRELAQHTVRLPTAYCLNVAVAGAIVMHDRIAKA
jgi:tRNA G18 (ribose-2'-O)-methylase SpoU